MPTYEFRCPAGHLFDRFYRKISDAQAEVPCLECGEPAARQLSGGAGLVFKGSGFYLTDYGKNAHRTSGSSGEKKSAVSGESSSGGSGSGSDKSSASGGDSKPSGEGKSSDKSSSGSGTV